MLVTPQNIRTLQRKLYLKAKQEPTYRFYSLYDKLCRYDILSHAYNLVRQNGGSPGIDGVSFKSIKDGIGEVTIIKELEKELREKRYRCQPVLRVWIPKADGSQRPLGIPTIRDRVVQMACKIVIEPIFESDFCDHSYGFRPKRSAHNAIDAISQALLSGHYQVIDADLSKYFDTIPHAKLMAVIAERISDKSILALIKQWLKAPVIERTDKRGKSKTISGKKNRRGTPQGGVISPLLANLYLHILDRIWTRHNIAKQYRARMVRYADDFVILCKGSTDKPLQLVRWVLYRCDLTLNENKTRIVDARKDGFKFLGFQLQVRKSRKSGKLYPHVEPAESSVERVKYRIKELTDRKRTGIPLFLVIYDVNNLIRGWSTYFHHGHSTKVLGRIKWFAEESVRSHLAKRYKTRGRTEAYSRYTTKYLYEALGLFKIPTHAKWKKAHALR